MLNFEDLDTVNEVKSERELLEEIEKLKGQVSYLQQQLDDAGDIEAQFEKAEALVLELEAKGGATKHEIEEAKNKINFAYMKILDIHKIKKELGNLQAQVASYIAQVADITGACLD